MYPEEDFILISGLQHLNFCERQWALIHMEQEWAENVLTIEGKQLHDHVHEQGAEPRGKIRMVRGLQLSSAKFGLYGVADLVEFHSDENYHRGNGGRMDVNCGDQKVYPVEYKRGRKRYDRSDEIQLCAQALCLEEMLQTIVPEGAIFYGQPRRRHLVSFNDDLRGSVQRLCDRARELLTKGRIPPPVLAHHCSNCSLATVCMPEIGSKDNSKMYMEEMWKSIAGGAT